MRPCRIDAPPAGWPPLQLLALFPRPVHGAPDAVRRETLRRLVRQVLQERAGQALAAGLLELPRDRRGAQAVSISHGARLSLLAWCPSGTVGVDLVELDSLAQAIPPELVATAALYLGPDAAAQVAAAAHAGQARTRFAVAWAGMEARLKCLGLALDEWQPERARSLANVHQAAVRALDADGLACTGWVGSIAWRA